MKITTTLILAAVLSATCLCSKAQGAKDACSLITGEQINKIIGCKLTQSGPSILNGKHCVHKSADFKSDVTLEYHDWNSENTARDMIKMSLDESKRNISAGKKAVGIYTSCKDFTPGGQNAFVLTGAGDTYTNGNVVRLQFVIGSVMFTFDTRGIDMNKVVPNLEKIYSIIKAKY